MNTNIHFWPVKGMNLVRELEKDLKIANVICKVNSCFYPKYRKNKTVVSFSILPVAGLTKLMDCFSFVTARMEEGI